MRRDQRQAALLFLCRQVIENGRNRTGREHDLLGRITAQHVEETRIRMESRYQEWRELGSSNPSAITITQAKDRQEATRQAWKRESHTSRRLARAHARARFLRCLDCYLVLPVRRLAKWNDIGTFAALLITGTLGASGGMILAVAFASSLASGLAVVAIAFALGIAFPVGALLSVRGSSAEKLREIESKRREQDFRKDWARVQHEATAKECSRLERGAAARDRFEEAKQRYESYRAIHLLKKNQLLLRDWRSLRGIPFEQFLAEVFEDLGYSVQTTKASGDQGVDLIVTIEGHRVAIQTKGYEKSVGNNSVQEVSAGMQFYHCDACAVVTNSRFTRSAIALARSTGCQLIEGDDIPLLIRGELVLAINTNPVAP
jgi:hypothetical protein